MRTLVIQNEKKKKNKSAYKPNGENNTQVMNDG